MQFELSVMTKLNDDMLQIVEQILPYFQPSYNLTVELVETIKEKRDVPVVLKTSLWKMIMKVTIPLAGVLLYTLRFTAKTYLFGPVTSASKDIIKKATVSYIAGKIQKMLQFVILHTPLLQEQPKDYTGPAATTLVDDITKAAKSIEVEDASGLTAKTYIDIGEEELFIKTISGNKLTVLVEGRTILLHTFKRSRNICN